MRESVENLVVGGGPAGSMLALRLAAAGREVMLLEKEREAHHKVCGEFLSREAVDYLQRIGIEVRDLGGHTIHSVRMHSGRRAIEAQLPFTALSLSRRILDESLLDKASSSGCEVQRGAFAERILALEDDWAVQLRGGKTLRAKTMFLATGKHDVKEWERGKGSQNHLVGFKMHFRLDSAQMEALRGRMELFLFRDGYGGLALVENEIANLCFVVRRKRLREVGGWMDQFNALKKETPGIAERLQFATPCWTKPLAVSPIPYGYLGGPANGIWRIGDQAAVIPSFTGDGMSIALHSAELAAEMYLDGRGPDEYLRRLEIQLRPGMRFATALSRMMITAVGRMIAPVALAIRPETMSLIAAKTRIPSHALRNMPVEDHANAGHLPAPVA